MRKIDNALGARLVDSRGNVRSFTLYLSDLDDLKKKADGKELMIQLVERASCLDFSAAEAVRMTMKYPKYAFDEWDSLDPADYSDVMGNSEMFADSVMETCTNTVTFECQRILSEEEHLRFNETGKYDLLINDDGLDDIILPKRNIEKEKAEFIREIKRHNSKVKTLDVDDITINSFEDEERKIWIGVTAIIRSICFSYDGCDYSALFNMHSRILKPDDSSYSLAKISYEDDGDFDEDSFRPISEAFSLEKHIPITTKLKTKLSKLDR